MPSELNDLKGLTYHKNSINCLNCEISMRGLGLAYGRSE